MNSIEHILLAAAVLLILSVLASKASAKLHQEVSTLQKESGLST